MASQAIDIFSLVETLAKELGVDPDLAAAITTIESGGNPLAMRFEPGWKYHKTPEVYAGLNGISVDTERVLQATSWGPMQVMGTVCREYGYRGPLVNLTKPEVSLRYALLKLKSLCEKYEDEAFAISAYNCGTPRKDFEGKFSNDAYVKKVQARLKVLRRIV